MYRSCIFCSAPLGANEAVERFPVGRSLAFDGEKGRLWAVCPKCARWNLAPIEERWEATEEAERLFRATRLRVQSQNIGLAKLRDGTRLVRVGGALPGEMAAWRYGAQLHKRRRRFVLGTGVSLLAVAGITGSTVLGFSGIVPLLHLAWVLGKKQKSPELHRFKRGTLLPDADVQLNARGLRTARLAMGANGLDLVLMVPVVRDVEGWERVIDEPRAVTGPLAESLLQRGMVHVNASGAAARHVVRAVDLLAASGSAQAYLHHVAAGGEPIVDASQPGLQRKARSLALEMALHEETERRALDGELAMLEAMWREAEEIASIADRLPDIPAPNAPRLTEES